MRDLRQLFLKVGWSISSSAYEINIAASSIVSKPSVLETAAWHPSEGEEGGKRSMGPPRNLSKSL
jgi:hypothetical protein